MLNKNHEKNAGMLIGEYIKKNCVGRENIRINYLKASQKNERSTWRMKIEITKNVACF